MHLMPANTIHDPSAYATATSSDNGVLARKGARRIE